MEVYGQKFYENGIDYSELNYSLIHELMTLEGDVFFETFVKLKDIFNDDLNKIKQLTKLYFDLKGRGCEYVFLSLYKMSDFYINDMGWLMMVSDVCEEILIKGGDYVLDSIISLQSICKGDIKCFIEISQIIFELVESDVARLEYIDMICGRFEEDVEFILDCSVSYYDNLNDLLDIIVLSKKMYQDDLFVLRELVKVAKISGKVELEEYIADQQV